MKSSLIKIKFIIYNNVVNVDDFDQILTSNVLKRSYQCIFDMFKLLGHFEETRIIVKSMFLGFRSEYKLIYVNFLIVIITQ